MKDASLIVRKLKEYAEGEGLILTIPEGLVVPYFSSEFNRCIDHARLNKMVSGELQTEQSWHQVTPVCRLNDMRKVDSGRHLTLFEVGALVTPYPGGEHRSTGRAARECLVYQTLDLLVGELGLSLERLGVTYFAGGEVMPGTSLEQDDVWKRLWCDAGISSENVYPVCGMKNYVLFVGDRERCGPKCEVLYNVSAGVSPSWLEVGTLIVDEGVIRSGFNDEYRIDQPTTTIAGAAFGIERLAAATGDTPMLFDLPFLSHLAELVRSQVRQASATLELVEGDIRVLVDQTRAACFIFGSVASVGSETPLSRAFSVVLRRIRRKLAVLCVSNPIALVSQLSTEVSQEYGRYAALIAPPEEVAGAVASVPWPLGWNPESYLGSGE